MLHPPAVVGPAFAVVLVALLLAPTAYADHVLAHRYVVEGRVVDTEGNPVVGLHVPYGRTGFPREDWCTGTDSRGGITDEDGWFSYCFATGELEAWMDVRLDVTGEMHIQHVEPDFRRNVFLVQTARVDGTPLAENASRPYDVAGTLWQSTAPGVLDGLNVSGMPVPDEAVTVTLLGERNATLGVANATTDAYGDYAVRFDIPANVTPVAVLVDARGDTRTFPADATFRHTRADFPWPGNAPHPDLAPRLPPGVDAPRQDDEGVDVQFPQSRESGETPPGSETPPFWGSGASVFTFLALVAAVAYLRYRVRNP